MVFFRLIPALILASVGLARAGYPDPLPQTNTRLPSLSLRTNLSIPEPGKKNLKIHNSLQYRPAAPTDSVCFLMNHGILSAGADFEPLRHLDTFLKREPKKAVLLQKQHVRLLSSQSLRVSWLSPDIFQLKASEKVSAFEFRHGGEVSEDINDLVLSGFFPRPLSSCPEPGGEEPLIQVSGIQARIFLPEEVEVDGPGEMMAPGFWQLSVRAPGFSLILNPKAQKVQEFSHAGVLIRLSTLGQGQEPLASEIRAILDAHTRLFGPFPYRQLSILERPWSFPPDSPGLVVFNRPDQPLFRYLQKDVLNWQYWALSALIAAQWFGSSVRTSPADDWLLAGVCDYASAEFLNQHPERNNLFNYYDHEISWASLRFRQVQDMAATLLAQKAPRARLTTSRLTTDRSPESRHPLRFIRHSIALRYLAGVTGREKLRLFFHNLAEKFRSRTLNPEDFFQEFQAETSASASALLYEWWTKRGWPDYRMEYLNSRRLTDGQWLTSAGVSSDEDFSLPFRMKVTDQSGASYYVSPSPVDGARDRRRWQASLLTDLEPVRADIDPDYQLFDSDRFNNSSGQAGLSFFPFGTNTLSDKNYTSVWMPYLFRRPGENTSVAIQMAFLRYLQSGLYLRLETSPADRKTGISLRYQQFVEALNGKMTASVSQEYEGNRTTELALHFLAGQYGGIRADPGLAVRLHQYPGRPGQTHPTAGAELRFSAGPAQGSPASLPQAFSCHPVLNYGLEIAPEIADSSYRYQRHQGSLSLGCETGLGGLRYGLRLFQGLLENTGDEVPESVYFRANDLNEAGLRIDTAGLQGTSSLSSVTQELGLPLSLPGFLDILHLSNKMRLSFFYDLGFPERRREAYYETSGLGIQLPVGGDIMGMGSLTISRVSLLGIFYSRRDKDISRKPKILFDISGEL